MKSPSLLVINSSGRITRSVTRLLTARFTANWLATHPGAEIIRRDVGMHPPTPMSEAWIAAAYAPPQARTPEMAAALEESEMLISEIERADAIVMGVPMYNFGMPAQLKAYFEQIIRSGRTFQFSTDKVNPYLPLLQSKPVTIITTAGAEGYEPGGSNAAINFLEPQLTTVLGLIGLVDIRLVRLYFEGSRSTRFLASLAQAEQEVDEAANNLIRGAALATVVGHADVLATP